MAAPKCRYDNKTVDRKTAFKVVIGDKNTYWCCEEHYNLYLEDKEKQDKITAEYDEIFELTKQIFQYNFTGYSVLKREVNAWEKISTRAKIISYLKENKSWLSDVMSKDFDSDYGRVRYYSVVVSSKLHDYKPVAAAAEKPKVVVEETLYESAPQSFNRRRSLADLEDMF